MKSTINDIEIINLPKIEDPRGNLCFIEEGIHVPFEIERVYWIYDVPGGQSHGGYAFKKQNEFILALTGNFDITVDDGDRKKTYTLNRTYSGLYLPSGIWRQFENFSTNSVALILSSNHFSKDNFIRNYLKFIDYKKI